MPCDYPIWPIHDVQLKALHICDNKPVYWTAWNPGARKVIGSPEWPEFILRGTWLCVYDQVHDNLSNKHWTNNGNHECPRFILFWIHQEDVEIFHRISANVSGSHHYSPLGPSATLFSHGITSNDLGHSISISSKTTKPIESGANQTKRSGLFYSFKQIHIGHQNNYCCNSFSKNDIWHSCVDSTNLTFWYSFCIRRKLKPN